MDKKYLIKEVMEEHRKIAKLRRFIDFSLSIVATEIQTPEEGIIIMKNAKKFCLSLFPGKEFQFDLIYAPRFKRALKSRFPNVIILDQEKSETSR